MDRISHIEYRGHKIILADCSDCGAEELTAIVDEVPRHITKEPLNSVLLLGDFSRAVFSKEAVEHLKIAAVFVRPHLKKSAWVLTENLPKTLYESIRSFSARQIPTFGTREEALEYLATDLPANAETK